MVLLAYFRRRKTRRGQRIGQALPSQSQASDVLDDSRSTDVFRIAAILFFDSGSIADCWLRVLYDRPVA